ncbi:mitochondrial carrier domain-containing protein [Gaertneriomyces semiglobifer]|nr:mitochondrial carrier domain-containing protein [Gaertneriomyces semiglobifer]
MIVEKPSSAPPSLAATSSSVALITSATSPTTASTLDTRTSSDPIADYMRDVARSNAVTIAATSAAVTSVLCGFPFDSIKTRMQAFRFPSTMDCIRTTLNNEGIAGFFRGCIPIIASISVLRSLSFSMYNGGKQEVKTWLPEDTTPLTSLVISSSLSGAFAGSVIATLNAPIDFIKLQRQLERMISTKHVVAEVVEEAVASASPTAAAGLGEGASVAAAAAAAEQRIERQRAEHGSVRRPPGTVPNATSTLITTRPPPDMSTLDWAKRIVHLKGPTGLYAGYSMHLLRDAIGTAMYFCGYETAKYLLTREGRDPGPLIYMTAGGLAGTLSWLVLFPIDITKSVLQREALNPSPKYNTPAEFVRIRWAKRGLRGFYTGIGPQLIRSFPVHSINFLVYEHVLKLCKGA